MPEKGALISIGIPAIDTLLGGGLRQGTTCLLEEFKGESSGLTGIAGQAFLLKGVQQGYGGILLLSEHTVDEFQALPGMESVLAAAKPKKFVFMDALSSLTYGEPTPDLTGKQEGVITLSNVRYAPKFYEEFRSIVSQFEYPIIFIDSLSVLLHAMESDRAAWQFWLSLLPLIRHRQLTVVAAFYPEMHSPAFVEGIERICDTIIQFTSESTLEKKAIRHIQVMKNRGLDFDDRKHPYTLKEFQFSIPSID